MSDFPHGSGIPLGPFQLAEVIGRGGMGEVWRGRHQGGLPVAVKVMTGERARQPRYRSWFRREVQAVAGLDHPGIVLVLDHGEAAPETEGASGGLIRSGSPYLAMELAQRTLAEAGVGSWPQLRAILLALLDALAHAHARGLVHRDLKPSNVLVMEEAPPRFKLADFGLAYAARRRGVEEGEEVAGTPWYMAPEQVLGHWRDDGPWTDLYAVGCVAWELVTGRPLVGERSVSEAAQAQLAQEPPPFRPVLPVPAGFEGWVRRLLRKRPRERFQRAADAAFGLERLGDATGEATPAPPIPDRPTVPDFAHHDTDPVLRLEIDDAGPSADAHADAEPRDTDALPEPLAPRLVPPFPASWRLPAAPPPPATLIGAGLGLFGLRPIRFVGRHSERDRMWQTLDHVRRTGQPRAIVLHGPAGTGKTRLAEWIGERAHEVGAALGLEAVHGPLPGPHDGLPGMVARFLRCQGLPPSEVLARTEAILRGQGVVSAGEWRGLAHLMNPEVVPPGVWLPAPSPAERHGLVRRLLLRATRKRPLVVRLDDVQWGAESLAFVGHVVDDSEPVAVLFLMTVRDEALTTRPLEEAALASLLSHPRVTPLEVPPLPRAESRDLVQSLLGLEGHLASQVAERAGGNPLFAVHLVGDWVQRGVLEPGPAGFALKSGETAPLPDDLHQVWAEHIGHLLDGWPAPAREALEIAAALGQSVDVAEWDEACSAAGVGRPPGLLGALVASRLARRTEDGWQFAHNMLRECVERLAREGGRRPALHRACAAMLASRERRGERGVAERLGQHLLQANEQAAALEPLLRAARERRETSDYALALRLLDAREQALDALAAASGDRRRLEGWVLRARIGLHQGRLGEVFTWAERARAAALAQGWADLSCESLRLLGDAARREGDLDQAAARYAEAIGLLDQLDNPHGVAASLWGLGDVHRQQGRLEQATGCFARSRSLYEAIGDEHGLGDFLIGMADAAWQKREMQAAAEQYAQARDLFARLGNRYGVARAANGLGEAARARGALAEADAYYRRALELLELLASAEVVFPRLNLGLTALARGQDPDAALHLQAAADELRLRGWRGALAIADIALLAVVALPQRWAQWDGSWAEAASVLRDAGIAEPDAAWAAEQAGLRAAAAGENGRARQALELAREQLQRLGDAEGAARVEGLLQQARQSAR